jgi:hypothetical protein
MSHAELMDALGSRHPRGLFHIQATEGLARDHPALVGAIGIDPGVRNLVTSSLGVKVTREDYRMYLILPPPLLQEINRLWR